MAPRAHLSRQSGMTLVEVMLVVFIVGIVAGIAVMTLPQQRDARERAITELEQSIQQVRDMSVLTGDTMALQARDGSVSLLRWDGVEWQDTGRSLAQLPEGVDVRLERPGEREQDRRQDARMLIFDPLGVSEPANLVVSYRGFRQVLSIGPNGEVSLGQSS